MIHPLGVHVFDDGHSVADLCDVLLARFDGDIELTRRLETVVTQSLGRGWREAATRRFDLGGARRGLRLYAATEVPTVPQPIPPEVKHVHFVVDLSTTSDLSLANARKCSRFFKAVLPDDA